MSVQICIIKTGETVIGDIKEVLDAEQNKSLGYKVQHPYVLNYNYGTNLKVSELSQEVENTEDSGTSYTFSAWAPLAAEREFNFPYEFVECIYSPHNVVTEAYNVVVKNWLEQNLNKVNVDSSKTIVTQNVDISTAIEEENN